MEDYNEIPRGPVLGVKLIIRDINNQVLALVRSKSGTRANGWDFVGGLVEFGEDPKKAVTREALEETGLSIQENMITLLDCYSEFKILPTHQENFTVILGFTCQLNKIFPINLSSEHTEHQWLDYQQALKLDWPPVHRQFLIQLKNK